MSTTTPQPLDTFDPRIGLFDPRVVAAVADLSDAEVAELLRQMCMEWTPDEDPDAMVAGSAANNRTLVIEVAGMNVGMGGEAEFETFTRLIAQATAHRSAA